eukprot:gene8893-1595_t
MGAEVALNVYEICCLNEYLEPLGIGAYHTGVEVYGREYAFGKCDAGRSGIFFKPPGCGIPGFKQRTLLGTTSLSLPE